MRSLLRRYGLLVLLLIPILLLTAWVASGAFDLWVAEQRWSRGGLVNYRYTLRMSCFHCLVPPNEPLVVEVQNGVTVRIRIAASGEEVQPEQVRGAGTIPGLFTIIHSNPKRSVAGIDVRYDEVLGYPTTMSINPRDMVLDDEFSYQITDLAEIP